MADDQNPFSQFSPEDQASIKEQLQALKNSGKLNPAQSASVDSAIGNVAKAGARTVIAPPPKLDPVAIQQTKNENAAKGSDATAGSVAREGALGFASGIGLPETKNASDFAALPGLFQFAKHPIDSAGLVAGSMLDSQKRMLSQSGQDFSDAGKLLFAPGKTSENLKNAVKLAASGVVHGVGGIVPIVGPAAVGAGDEVNKGIQKGDANAIAHGTGQGAGLLFSLGMGTKKGASAGGAVEGAIDSGAGAAQGVLRDSAVRNINATLGPTTKANKFLAQKVAPEIVDRGIVAGTRKGLEAKTAAGMDAAGDAIDQAVSALPKNKTVSTQPIIDALEQSKQQFVNTIPATAADLSKNPQMVRKLSNGALVKDIPVDPEAINRIDALKNIVDLHGSDVSFTSLRNLRQIWDSAVAQGNGYAGKTLAEGSKIDAQRLAANAIRNELAKASPDIAKLNAEYNFWANANKVISDTNLRKTGQATPLTQNIATSGGAIAGGLVKGTFPGVVEGAIALRGVNKLIHSAAWNTVSAQVKSKLADSLSAGDISGANSIADSALAAGATGSGLKKHLDSALADATAKGKPFDRNAETKKIKLLFQGVE